MNVTSITPAGSPRGYPASEPAHPCVPVDCRPQGAVINLIGPLPALLFRYGIMTT